MDLQTNIEQEIQRQAWWQPNQPVIVSVSTGVDSMVLLHLLQHLHHHLPKIIVAHVNHQLRAQSQLEEQFLRKYCEEHALQLVIKRWQHESITKGMEAQARTFRYQFFKELMHTTGAKVVLTAHQQNDQAETVLMKLVRSGNLNEVSGIKPSRPFANGQLIRPLLNVSRTAIETYAKQHQLTWFEDETNHTDDVQRNRIRHHVLPQLSQENPQAVAHLADFALQLQQQNQIYQQLMQASLHQLPGFSHTANLVEVTNYKKINNLRPVLQQMVASLAPLHLTSAQLNEIEQLLANQQKPQGSIDLEKGLQFQKNYQKIKFKKTVKGNKSFREKQDFMVVLNHWYDLPNGNSVAIFKSENVPAGDYRRKSFLWLTSAQFPLQIRASKATDRVTLKGGGHKKLRRILIDCKVPNDQRNLMYSLVDQNNEVLSVLGVQESSTNKAQQTNLYVLLVK